MVLQPMILMLVNMVVQCMPPVYTLAYTILISPITWQMVMVELSFGPADLLLNIIPLTVVYLQTILLMELPV